MMQETIILMESKNKDWGSMWNNVEMKLGFQK
jgi:hypothetical protein